MDDVWHFNQLQQGESSEDSGGEVHRDHMRIRPFVLGDMVLRAWWDQYDVAAVKAKSFLGALDPSRAFAVQETEPHGISHDAGANRPILAPLPLKCADALHIERLEPARQLVRADTIDFGKCFKSGGIANRIAG